MTLETFLQGCAGKVAVLLGQNGSGKTVLMSSLGQQWANGLVSLHYCYIQSLLGFFFRSNLGIKLCSVVLVLSCTTHTVHSNYQLHFKGKCHNTYFGSYK